MSVQLRSYTDFSSSLHAGSLAGRIPLLGTLEVSHRCSLNCSHCYNNLPMADLAAARRELTKDEYFRILDELADLGCVWMLFTGGEIFARRDFLDIYADAKKKGFIITLFTNGTLVSEKIADYLAEWRPFRIEITLYGRTKETYERLTRVPGSYERCLRGIRLLKERGLPLSLKTVAVTVNRHEIWDMKKFAEEDLGLPFKLDSMINPRTDCSASPLGVRLSPEEVIEVDLASPEQRSEWATFAERFTAPAHPVGKENEVYHCGGGINSFAIDPYGKMSICVLSHREEYDVRQGSVREGWESFLRDIRDRRTPRITKCTSCQIKAMCGMCPANGELENGDPESPVDFLCHTAHLRSYTLGAAVPAHGVCEYCEGGVSFDQVKREADGLRARLGEFPRPLPAALPVLTATAGVLPTLTAAAGCGGCGGH